jgi:hypothetical protein
MQMETKFLRLRTPVELGSLFGDWRVCWQSGWSKPRIYYLVADEDRALKRKKRRRGTGLGGAGADRLLRGEAVGALSFGALEGLDLRPHLFPDGATQKPAYRVGLPAGDLYQFL